MQVFVSIRNAILLTACFYCACDRSNVSPQFQTGISENYEKAIQSGVQGPSYPEQFNKLYPGTQNIISYYTGKAGPPSWTSSIGLYGRYVLKVHLSIQLDKERTNILSYGVPTFYLYELPKITLRTNASPYIQLNQITTFSTETWSRLLEAKGDLQISGFNLETNKPVQGFDANWRTF